MNYLTPDQILFLHARLIEETGGSHGLRDLGLLEPAAARPRAIAQPHITARFLAEHVGEVFRTH